MNSSMTSKSAAPLPSSSSTSPSRMVSDGEGSHGLLMATSRSSASATLNPSRLTGLSSRTRNRPNRSTGQPPLVAARSVPNFGVLVHDPADHRVPPRITQLEVQRHRATEDEQADHDPRGHLEQ